VAVEFGLLGPLLVALDEEPIRIPAARQRTILAKLLLQPNQAISGDRLIDALWPDLPPHTARASLHTYVMRLRKALGTTVGARIRTSDGGYVLDVGDGELDTDRFHLLRMRGRTQADAGDWTDAAASLRAALDLWRGEPLSDIGAIASRWSDVAKLAELHLQTAEEWTEAEMCLGRNSEMSAELRTLVAEHPLREPAHRLLMLALFRSDRQAEALGVFRRLQQTLRDDLGIRPSASLQLLHQRILRADPTLSAGPSAPLPVAAAPRSHSTSDATTVATRTKPATAPVPAGVPRPCQLPADTRVFTGRARELEQLLSLADESRSGTDAGMVVISAVDGMAGVGKTSLAIHAAHHLRQDFPDGQLFLDLRGHTAGLEPLTAEDALDRLLRSLGVPPQLIPRDLGARSAFYRDLLAGTRTLIVLDNASGAAQILPLLPGAPGCLVIVTSRKRLIGLDDIHSVPLDVLPAADAAALLRKVAGPGRVPDGHPAVEGLLALCGHLPLAIRIVGSRLRRHNAQSVDDLVRKLSYDTARLEHLDDEDRGLTAVFDLSYLDLTGAEQRLFRLLALVPGLDFDPFAAANLAGTDLRTAERLLDSLLDHSLLVQHLPGRYRFHDLLRLYAGVLNEGDPAAERGSALDRLLDYYHLGAEAANVRIARHIRPGRPPATGAGLLPELSGRPEAMRWMRAERDNLLALIGHSALSTRTGRLVPLSGVLASFLLQEGPWPQADALHQAALTAARERGDLLGEATTRCDLSRIGVMRGDYPAAIGHLEQALAVFQGVDERLGEAVARCELGRVLLMTGEFSAAAELQKQSMAIYQELGHRQGEADAMHVLARVHFLTGDYPAAAELQTRALSVFEELDHPQGVANVLWDLGRLHGVKGEYRAAAAAHERALAIYRELGHPQGEANCLWELGRVRLVTGDYAAAAEFQQQSRAAHRRMGNRPGAAYACWDLGRVRFAMGDHPAAAELHEEALGIFQDIGSRLGEANARHDLGRTRHATGDHVAAAELLAQSLALFRDLGDRQGEAEVLNSIGAFTADTGDIREALATYRTAQGIASEIQSPLDEARARDGAGRCLSAVGDREAARAELEAAVALYRRLGAVEATAATAALTALTGPVS